MQQVLHFGGASWAATTLSKIMPLSGVRLNTVIKKNNLISMIRVFVHNFTGKQRDQCDTYGRVHRFKEGIILLPEKIFWRTKISKLKITLIVNNHQNP